MTSLAYAAIDARLTRRSEGISRDEFWRLVAKLYARDMKGTIVDEARTPACERAGRRDRRSAPSLTCSPLSVRI